MKNKREPIDITQAVNGYAEIDKFDQLDEHDIQDFKDRFYQDDSDKFINETYFGDY
jgi:Ca2+-binding EF-hand superfamily protein